MSPWPPRSPVLAVVALSLAIGSCEPPEPESTLDPELVEALGLAGDEVIHRIALGGRGSEEHVVPPTLEVAAGEIVEFVTVDRRVHVVRFTRDSLSTEAARFLGDTRQGSSPPMIQQGSRYVVTFENAPPGRYPFLVSGYGEDAGGAIIVR